MHIIIFVCNDKFILLVDNLTFEEFDLLIDIMTISLLCLLQLMRIIIFYQKTREQLIFNRYQITTLNENPISHLSSIDREKSPVYVKNVNIKEEKLFNKGNKKVMIYSK